MPFSLNVARLARLGGMLASLAAAPLASAAAAEAEWYDGRWPHERHQLQSHPDAVFGRLENGFRYVILPHDKPAGRVHLALDVQVGSLMEAEDERGIAHYLEHMAFNGSRHFPPGALIPFLQSHGMRFGGDANAHTSAAETVYKLDLARTAPDDLDTGLRVLRDIAGDLSLEPQEVDKERGVILAEKSARDTEKSRQAQHRRDLMFAGTKFVNETIGVDDTIGSVDAARLRRFYDSWYRPERMILVAVGDVDAATLRGLIQARFADLSGRGAAAIAEDWGDIRHQGVIARHEKTATAGLAVAVTALHPRERRPDTLAEQRRHLAGMIAREMFQRRLEAARNRTPVFVGAKYGTAHAFDLFPSASVSATCVGGQEAGCLSTLGQELNSALSFGFSKEEFAAARAFLRTRIDAQLAQSPHRQSKEIAQEIVATLNSDQVFQSEAQTRATVMPALDSMDKAEVEAVFRADWNSGNRIIWSSGDADLGAAPEAALIRAWEAGESRRVRPQPAVAASSFPYLPEPTEPLAVVAASNRALPGSDLTERRIELAQGLTLRLLPTPFDRGRLSLNLLFGPGLDPLSDRDHAIALTTARVLRASGVGGLDRETARRTFAARQIKIEEGYSDNSFSIAAEGATGDMDLLLTALWTQFSDPHPREDEYRRLLENLKIGRNDRLNTLDGAAPGAVQKFLFGGAKRSGELDETIAASVTVAEMKEFLARSRSAGPRTLVAVGDFDPDAVAARAALLFASAPSPTASVAAPERPAPVFPAGQSHREEVAGGTGEALVVLAWRLDTEDEADLDRLAARRLLATVLNDRMRDRVREEMGAAYSPSVRYRYDPASGGYGFYAVTIKTDRALAGQVKAAAADVARTLSAASLPPGTADRVRATAITAAETQRQRNRYWQNMLEQEAVRGKPFAEWSARQIEALRAVGDADLEAAAAALADSPADIVVTENPATAAAR